MEASFCARFARGLLASARVRLNHDACSTYWTVIHWVCIERLLFPKGFSNSLTHLGHFAVKKIAVGESHSYLLGILREVRELFQ
jgi:hypothetical protein